MTQKDQTGTAPANAPHWTSRWRATYRQGEWLVLSGPTSLVVMQPAAPQWSDLINAVWEDVLGAASLADLAARMAEFRLDGMPDFAALFWDRDQMRSLVRGRVRLVDPDTGRPVATGEGVQTWTEVGLGDLQQVEVHAGDQTEDEQLELPLVIGAVNASRVLLDCSDEMQIRSPQGTFVGNADALDRLDAPAEPSPAPSSVEAEASGASPAASGNAAAPGAGSADAGSGAAAVGGAAVGGAAAGGVAAGGAAAGGAAGPSAAPATGRPAHAADDDADRAETLVDQPAVRSDADSGDRSAAGDQAGPDRPDAGSDQAGPRSGTDRPDGSRAGGEGAADQRGDSAPQHASPAATGAVGGAALGAAAAGAAAAGAGAAAAGPSSVPPPSALSGPGPSGPGSGSPSGAAPSQSDPSHPGAGPSGAGQSGAGQSGPSQPGSAQRPDPSTGSSRPDGQDADAQDDDGHTMVADGLPGMPARGRTDEPPQRSVLGVLHPSSGGTVDIDRPVVIGRAPVASRVRSDQLPRLLTVPSPSHDISRTHVQIAPENGRLVVTDLNSTNGTILVMPDGRRTDLRPGVGVPADFGSVIDLGDGITIAVEHS